MSYISKSPVEFKDEVKRRQATRQLARRIIASGKVPEVIEIIRNALFAPRPGDLMAKKALLNLQRVSVDARDPDWCEYLIDVMLNEEDAMVVVFDLERRCLIPPCPDPKLPVWRHAKPYLAAAGFTLPDWE